MKTQNKRRTSRGSDRLEADNFRLGYRLQTHWDASVGAAFFFGEFGAGLFLVALWYGHVAGMIVGLLAVGIGKTVFQAMHTGVRQRAWRAILRPDRSWISRGFVALIAFMGFGILYVAAEVVGFPPSIRIPLAIAAGASAVVVATYQGFAMAHSTAIAIWSSALMPVASLIYSVASGAAVLWAMTSFDSALPPPDLAAVTTALLVAVAIALAAIVHAGYHGSPGARVSAELLIGGPLSRQFYGAVVVLGIVLPLAILWLVHSSFAGAIIAAAGVLAGFLMFRVLILKVGVYEPVLPF